MSGLGWVWVLVGGWTAPPWGSPGGDPAQELSRAALGVGELYGVPVSGTLTYFHGELAEVRLNAQGDRMREFVDGLTADLGGQFGYGTAWVLGDGVTSAMAVRSSYTTDVVLVSDAHRARCVAELGTACGLEPTRAERAAELPEVERAMDATVLPFDVPDPPDLAEFEGAVRASCDGRFFVTVACQQAKVKLGVYWEAHPELRPGGPEGCVQRALPAKCWKW